MPRKLSELGGTGIKSSLDLSGGAVPAPGVEASPSVTEDAPKPAPEETPEVVS